MKLGNKNKINDRRFKFQTWMVSTRSSVKVGFLQSQPDTKIFLQLKSVQHIRRRLEMGALAGRH